MDVLNALNNVNVQIPVGYLLVFLAVVIGGYIAVKKMIAMALWAVARVSVGFFGYIASCLLFVGGLTGLGYSGGAMSNAPYEKPIGVLTDSRLERMTRDKDVTPDKLKLAIDYAEAHTKPISLSDATPEPFDWRGPSAMFLGSIGMTVIGIFWSLSKFINDSV